MTHASRLLILTALLSGLAMQASAASPEKLRAEQELLRKFSLTREQLQPLALDTALVRDGQAQAVICHADLPDWRAAATRIQTAVKQATGVSLPLKTDQQLTPEEAKQTNLILVGMLENHRLVAQLYHNIFACLDVGYTGETGYVIRSIHAPFGGGNMLLVGGSYGPGTKLAAEAFAALVKKQGRRGELVFGRLLVLKQDGKKQQETRIGLLDDRQRDEAIRRIRGTFAKAGVGRGGVATIVKHAIRYHRGGGDRRQAEVYKAGMQALREYYANDAYIKSEGLARYDRDFRDSWTHGLAISWDLLEESGVFDDAERLENTNFLIRLGLECVLYQGWQGARVKTWSENRDIVHNHNTFPALGVSFVGTYMKRHYRSAWADDWLAVAAGVFAGQKHSSKPLEDAASYQWLPILHTMLYTMARDDWTFFREGHARESAAVAAMVMDNAGYQSAFGDHSAYRASSALGTTLQRIAWQTRDPGILWAARRAIGGTNEHVTFNLGQPYSVDFAAVPPKDQRGAQVAKLPKLCYDYAARSPQYASKPNLPWSVSFDKLAFRAGFDRDDEYLLLDGFGRGTHMHFDANAIVRFSAGGEPLLVDGEYIKNAPKYHSSLVILRDGQSVLTPAVTALRSLASFGSTAITRTELVKYNGADWERSIVWRPKRYVLVVDAVTARTAGDYILRCCWRPWGEARLDGGKLVAEHAPMRLELINADGAPGRLETLKTVERMAISRLSQQVGRTMKPGDAYSFVNAFHAESREKPRQVSVQLLGPGVAVIDQPEGREVVAFGPGPKSLPGIATDASIAVFAEERLAVTDCRHLRAGGVEVLACTQPVSVEFEPGQGRAVVVAGKPCRLTLRGWTLAHDSAQPVEGGIVLDLPAGTHTLRGARAPMPAWVLAMVRSGSATSAAGAVAAAAPTVPVLKPLWERGGFDPAPEPLPILSVACEQPHYDRYGPVAKLADGMSSSSTSSVMWPAGTTATIVLELAAETQLERVLLREWHMNEDWDMGTRKLEVSSDGFKQDVRLITAPFRPAGKQSWGNNVNSFFAAPVGQRAKQVRLTLSPARQDSRVYVGEVELHGMRVGSLPAIRALSAGRLGKAGVPSVVAASDAAQFRAFSSDGTMLWSTNLEERFVVNDIACFDLDADGKDEVVYGGNSVRLGTLDSLGKGLWQVRPPDYRGIRGDVMTVFPADVDGDGTPEIGCGALNWQYFAYDAQGKQLWKNVIYAHSATVGCAADLDGDGRDEIVGGNAYYRLNLIDDDGTRIISADRFGPEQTAVLAADLTGDGIPEVIVGTDGGELLGFDAKGKRQWTRNVGDKVTRLLAVPSPAGQVRLVCAAESANLFCFDGTGKQLWRAALPDGVGDLVLVGKGRDLRLAAAVGNSGIAILSTDGKLLALAPTKGRALFLAALPNQIAAATTQGLIQAFPVASR